ncbi:hypothetical protein FDG94_gp087 [Pseudomonas phage SM1]|uniref:Uncharacterized protein n=2 Tax=Samunavirus TaxID=2560221 RepID=A0A0U3E1S6_9CAUD|nr:hypothetical protein FDG94_gp087 [Pseudomonas phage SM1]UGC97072.1 hypothetical protein [Pseudomonas phage BHU-1]UGV19969.1 hypothetical protein [Pseudomonas phage Pa BHU-15]UIW13592.1 hypothetical protein [Pseudomonas phage Pa BHU-17]UVN14125.1 hypothetical protein FBPa45_0124 [Pseudomonas phage vB_PaeS_FBPa45]WDS62484.1 hypothetical protein UFRH6_56 [Pseudomonas phage UF_RH6]
MTRVAASIEKFDLVKNVDRALAKRIRAIWRGDLDEVRKHFPETDTLIEEYYTQPGARELRRVIIDRLLDTCGVEYLGQYKRSGEHVHYCNAGDPYVTTVMFFDQRLVIGCWGDLVERNLIREPATAY